MHRQGNGSDILNEYGVPIGDGDEDDFASKDAFDDLHEQVPVKESKCDRKDHDKV